VTPTTTIQELAGPVAVEARKLVHRFGPQVNRSAALLHANDRFLDVFDSLLELSLEVRRGRQADSLELGRLADFNQVELQADSLGVMLSGQVLVANQLT
jgi:hypothetical protein